MSDDAGLRVRNVGRTVARDVRVQFDPPLPQADLDRLNADTPSGDFYYVTNVDVLQNVFEDRVYRTWTPGMDVAVKYWVAPDSFDPRRSRSTALAVHLMGLKRPDRFSR